tara:strand:- start:249 stop:605 length:357 start_codon:yes stop_codon:yes gene_type:complete
MSHLNPEKLVNYIQIRYKTRLDKEKLIELLTNYNSAYEESQKLLISMIFESLFGLTLESLNNLALSYNGRELSLDDSIKELQKSINDLSSKIDILTQDNEELRENYWRLNQSINKSKK